MKKSLSVLVATAMVSSIFASVAFAADELTTQEKLDALIAAGIFDKDGTGNGSELEANMSREQLAKILSKLKGLKEVTGTSYTDVASDRWSAGFIQAVSKATPPLMDGIADGVFDPAGDVTLEQLATVAVRALGLQVSSSTSVDGDVSDWAKGYVATAIANGLIGKKDDYTVPAIRSELVEASYAAKEVIDESVKPAKVSVKSAKATGVKKVEVTFDRDVDTTKAKLDLTRGSTAIATTVKFADDKKSATLTLTDAKISAGDYKVTLSGLEESAVAQASTTFTAEDEKLTKLEFLNANEYIAQSEKAIVKLRAVNQYDEAASVNPGEYNVYAGSNNDVFVKFTKNENNELLLTLNTKQDGLTPNLSVVPVNIVHNASRLSVSKTFRLGTAPFIQKMELSDVRYSNGKDAINGVGETATFDIFNYDQYGNLVSYNPDDDSNTQINFNPYPFDNNLIATPGDSNGDEVADVKVSLVKNIDKSEDYVLTVWNQAGMATTKVSVKSAKVATKVTLGQPIDSIAAGDTEAYVPITAYDASGAEVSLDDLVSTDNVGRINITSSAQKAELVTAGEHKGQIKLTWTDINRLPTKNSVVSLNVSITTPTANSFDTKNYNIQSARYPEYIKVATDPAKKIAKDATSDMKFVVYDQYGKEYKEAKNINSAGNVTDQTGAGIAQYRVTVTAQSYGNVRATFKSTGTPFDTANPTYYTGSQIGDDFNQTHKFSAVGMTDENGRAQIKAVIEKRVGTTADDKWIEASTPVTREIVAAKASEDLTYSLAAVSDLFATTHASVADAVYSAANEKVTKADQQNATASQFKREVKVTAKDAAGNTVALPGVVKSIQSSNPSIALAGWSANKGYVVGARAGTATLTVSFETNKGETVVRTVDVNVKADPLMANALSAGNKTQTRAEVTGDKLNAFVLMKLKVTDNYGISYEAATAQKYNYYFGVVFSIKSVVGGGTVTVDQYGNLTINGTVTSFELTATSPTGKTATTLISN